MVIEEPLLDGGSHKLDQNFDAEGDSPPLTLKHKRNVSFDPKNNEKNFSIFSKRSNQNSVSGNFLDLNSINTQSREEMTIIETL